MKNDANVLDASAIAILCLFGLGSMLLVFFAGAREYGVLSTLWREFGILNLFATSLLCFCVAAAILRRMWVRGFAYRISILVLLVMASLPTSLFAEIIIAKAIHVYGQAYY